MVTLVPMSSEDIPSWAARERDGYLAERIGAGEDPVQAERIVNQQHADLFPDGQPAKGQHVFQVLDGDVVIGHLWIGEISDGLADGLWVYKIEVDEPFRGRGMGRETMLAGEAKARELGAKQLGLNVFGYNTVARSLYEGLGYEATSIRMSKTL